MSERFFQQRTRYYKIRKSRLPPVDRDFSSSLNEEPNLKDFLDETAKSTHASATIPSVHDSEACVAGNREYLDYDRTKTFVVTTRRGQIRDEVVIDSPAKAAAWTAKRYGRILEVCHPKGSTRYAYRVYRPNQP